MPSGGAQELAPLALGQEREWEFMYSLAPGDPGRSRILAVDNRYLDGDLNLAALRHAFAAVTRQHETLRLAFHTLTPDPLVRIAAEIDPPVEFLDLSGQSAAAQDVIVSELVGRQRERSFDLRGGPLWHACIVRLEPARHLLSLCFFHIVADGWSCKVFMTDLMDAYGVATGSRPPMAGATPTFAEIRELQHSRLRTRPDRAAYWRDQLLPLPAAAVTPPLENVDLHSSDTIHFSFHPDLVLALRRVAWRARTTPFTALLACYYVLLSVSRGTDRVIGNTTTLGRPTALERRAISQCTADLYFPVSVQDRLQLVEVVRTTHSALECAIDNLMSFKSIARAVHPGFDQDRPWPDSYLFDGNCYSVAFSEPDVNVAGLRIRHVYIAGDSPGQRHPAADLDAGAMAPATRRAWQAAGAPSIVIAAARDGGALCFNHELFDAAAMRRFLDAFTGIVQELCTDPGVSVASLRRSLETGASRLA